MSDNKVKISLILEYLDIKRVKVCTIKPPCLHPDIVWSSVIIYEILVVPIIRFQQDADFAVWFDGNNLHSVRLPKVRTLELDVQILRKGNRSRVIFIIASDANAILHFPLELSEQALGEELSLSCVQDWCLSMNFGH